MPKLRSLRAAGANGQQTKLASKRCLALSEWDGSDRPASVWHLSLGYLQIQLGQFVGGYVAMIAKVILDIFVGLKNKN